MDLFDRFQARHIRLEERTPLMKYNEAFMPVYHLRFDIRGTGLNYKVGDCLALFPKNSELKVDQVMDALSLEDQIVKHPKSGREITLRNYLINHVDLRKTSSILASFFPEDNKSFLLNNIITYKPSISLSHLLQGLMPLMPRFYSIASSPQSSPNYIDLLIREVCLNINTQEFGLCSRYLCHSMNVGDEIQAYVQPTRHFTLSDQQYNNPIVLIGSGTGIAPFKAFIEQRIQLKDEGKNILFFGERHKQKHFYYQSFWNECIENSCLQLFTAFSRDGLQKVYVQDLIQTEKSLMRELFQQKASFFVCGSKEMGLGVKKSMENIFNQDELQALRQDKRYLFDVY